MTLPALVPALLLLATPNGTVAATVPAVEQVTPPPVVPTLPVPAPADGHAPSPATVDVAGEAPPPSHTHHHTRGDPLEGVNRKLFSVHNFFDRILFRPVAMVYKAIVPKPLRTGIRHVFSNLDEPVVFVNDLLQLKPKRAVRTFARFVINSSIGIGGVLDVAKKAELPHRPNGFGDTLGRYGVGPGPYLFIPFIGPTDLRDMFGGSADGALLPAAVGFPFDRREYTIPRSVLTGLDQRVESDADLKALYAGAADRYATLRSVYLQSRVAEIDEIRHGAATPKLDDPLLDPSAGTTPPASDAAPAATSVPPAPPSPDTSDPLTDPAKSAPAPAPKP